MATESIHDDYEYRNWKCGMLGPFKLNTVTVGDSAELIPQLPDESIDVVVTSPPYWGQRHSNGTGVEEDPRDYLRFLSKAFAILKPKIKPQGIIWINLGDAFNTPVNWRLDDRQYSTLGHDKAGLKPNNTAYTKPRAKRKAFVETDAAWLRYGNLLALPNRLVIDLCEHGYVYRGEVIWRKKNPMPEGRCRRPHRQHEGIYLLARTDQHQFRVTPPVGSVWDIANERIDGPAHFSRFPEELPRRCIESYGVCSEEVVVLDPFAGSGTTGLAALGLGCSFVGFEIDASQATPANERLHATQAPLFNDLKKRASGR